MRFYPFVFTGKERDEETCYGYCNDYQPHAVRHIFDEENKTHCDLRWDPAGNLGQISVSLKDNVFDHGRFLFWTEDSRMHAAVDDRYFSYYVYDHGGERRLKLTGDSKLLDVNADLMATYTVLNEPTLYPSAYMVLTNKGYTKHYYAGTERVAARLGGGGLDALYHVIGNDVELQKKADRLFKQSLDQVNHRVLGENDLKCIMNNEFARDEFGKRIDGIPYQVRSDVKVDNWQFKDMVHSMLYDRNQGHEKEVYFYHSDHLGSASWITDFEGIAVQHLQYLPYGEPYINQRPFGYSERFTFTGKEKDEETGYGYFGARYMDHELMTMWLSVDPMSDKYPSISPYAYCAWNPVKLVDPDGREIDGYEGSNGQYQWFDKHTEQSFVDENGVTWNIVTDDQNAWKEATTIREANIQGLESLGYKRSDAERDVRLYDGEDPLFTKESHLLNSQNYTSNWETAINSDEGNAKQSPEIKNTGYSLKFYPNKGGRKGANSLGIVQTSGLGHLFEAAMEVIERKVYGSSADSDPLYDMHYTNATGLIRRLNTPPVKEYQTPLYFRTGGMK